MHPFYRPIVSSFLLVILITIFPFQLLAEDDNNDSEMEKFRNDPIQWASAELPTPYGLIIDASYPSSSGNEDFKGFTYNFSLEAYYDMWAFGLRKKEYGMMITMMQRSMDIDAADGFLIEAGLTNDIQVSFTFYDEAKSKYIDTSFKYTKYFLGIGYRWITRAEKESHISYFGEITAGLSEPDKEVGGSDVLYAKYEIGIGYRFQFQSDALSCWMYAFVGYVPASDSKLSNIGNSESDIIVDDHLGIYGLAFKMQYAFNFLSE